MAGSGKDEQPFNRARVQLRVERFSKVNTVGVALEISTSVVCYPEILNHIECYCLYYLNVCFILSISGHLCTLQLEKVKSAQWNALLVIKLISTSKAVKG